MAIHGSPLATGAADRLWCIAQRNWFLRLLPMNDTRLKLMEAIARRRMISASYNGNRMTLAPHLMFERRGDLFVSALNLGKNWRSEEERRLGHFKLDGLGAAELLEDGDRQSVVSGKSVSVRVDTGGRRNLKKQ